MTSKRKCRGKKGVLPIDFCDDCEAKVGCTMYPVVQWIKSSTGEFNVVEIVDQEVLKGLRKVQEDIVNNSPDVIDWINAPSARMIATMIIEAYLQNNGYLPKPPRVNIDKLVETPLASLHCRRRLRKVVQVESVADMVSRLDSMASGEPSWDLSDNDMSALKHALQFVPGSDFYKPPDAENQGGPDSASTNSERHQCSRDTLEDHDTYFSCSVCHKMFPAEDIVGD